MKLLSSLLKVLLIAFFWLIISDWRNFKAGFNGKPPIAKEFNASLGDLP